MKKHSRKQKALLALGLLGVGAASNLSVVTVAKAATTTQTADGFDLTKQATTAPFPVMFDRPSGVNASALAGAVRSLGSTSALYTSAKAAVPEIDDSAKMNSLLVNALNNDATAKATIVKLINWYNSLGGFQLKTQSGAVYTVDNLNEPINTIAVGFATGANASTANKAASDRVQQLFGAVRTTGDVMKALDSLKSGTSTSYRNAFSDYAAKVNATNADIAALSEYSALKPLLDAYEGMYADGAATLRSQLLSTTGTTEAAVAFFESAVITGRVDSTDGGTSDSNTPVIENVTTRWVSTDGKVLSPNETGTSYKSSKTFEGYTLISERTENGIRTYTYQPNTARTRWVDESGATLKPEVDGTLPDKEGDDIPGYTFISTRTENTNGNVVTINTYRKTPTIEKTTDWVDESGTVLRPRETGNKPDTEGDDIPGYTLVSTKTTTDASGNIRTVNTYKKTPVKADITKWVDTSGATLKEPASGIFPDKEGDDIPGYKLVSTTSQTTDTGTTVVNTYSKAPDTYWVDEDGNSLKEKAVGQTLPDTDGVSDIEGYRLLRAYTVTQSDLDGTLKGSTFQLGDTINIYTKNVDTPVEKVVKTSWVDLSGNSLKDSVAGSHPDKEGDDLPGYTLVRIETDPDGNVKNVYDKVAKVTNWVDEAGNKLKDTVEGEHPDTEGDDIPNYKFIRTDVDKDGNVTNVYHKIVTNWVDVDGNSLKDSVDGSHPDKEGDDISGYKLEEIKTAENGDVTNVYRKVVKTHWVDENGTALKDPQDGEHPDTQGDDIPGYQFIRTEVDKDGNIINHYRKLATHWVDTNGNTLKDSVSGEFPDTEGDDIAGYTFVETKRSDNGDIINVYQQNVKTVITHYVDENGIRLLDDISGTEFAEQKEIDGYTFKEVRTSKDGTEKFYIYTKTPVVSEPAKTPAKSLPNTGEAGTSVISLVGAGLMSMGAGLVAHDKRRKSKNK